jgi:Plasma-membrane choline transporter
MFIWIGIVGLFVYFVYIGLYIITPTVPWSFTVAGTTWTTTNLQYIVSYYHLFGFLWGLWFMSGISQISIAGAIASWYWTMDKDAKMKSPILRSVGRTFRYHLGSVAVGSLLIAIVEFIRVLLYQVQRQVAKTKISWLKYLVACLQCCMACVSMIVKFINRNAYIYIG